MADEPRRCLGVNQDGTACGAPSAVIMDDGYCFSHSPSVRPEARSLAGALGGVKAMAKRRRGIDVGELKTPSDATRILARLTVAIAAGELPADQGRAALVGLQAWTKAFEVEQAEREIAAIEEQNRLRREGRD